MASIEISVFWTIVGIIIWPQMTLCVILWMLGHPILGIFALLATWTSGAEVVKTKYIDPRGRVVAESVE